MQLPQPPDVVDERYRLEHLLGSGGFATVYLASDLENRQRVALKLLKPERDGTYRRDVRLRVAREIKALQVLRSPHTVGLLAHGETNDGLLYLAFEHVDGVELAQVLQDRRRLPAREVEHILRQLLAALAEAHASGLLHRDLKPENVMITTRGEDAQHAILIDFGLARAVDDGSPTVTETGELIGTPRYMSPEQLTSRPLSPASDIYSLGMVAFEMLMGWESLQGRSLAAQIDRLRSGHVFSIAEVDRARPLFSVIERMCARNPEDRFASATSALAALSGPSTADRPVTIAKPRAPRTRWFIAASILVAAGVGLALRTPGSPPPKQRAPKQPVLTPTRPVPSAAKTRETVDLGRPKPDVARKIPAHWSSGCELPNLEESWRAAVGDRAVPVYFADAKDSQLLMLPPRYEDAKPVPLLVLAHDARADTKGPAHLLAGSELEEHAARRNMALVAPMLTHQIPTIGALTESSPKFPVRVTSDETRKLVDQLVREILGEACIDKSRVFLVGQGEGGKLVETLLCRDWVSAAAVNSHMLAEFDHYTYERSHCDVPDRRVPVMQIIPSASDHHSPVAGQRVCAETQRQIHAKSRAEDWSKVHACTGRPMAWKAGKHQCDALSCEVPLRTCVVDGGHPWPGTTQRPTRYCNGLKRIGKDGPAPVGFDTSGEILDFLFGATQMPHHR